MAWRKKIQHTVTHYFSERFSIVISTDIKDLCRWFENLLDSQKDELASLDEQWYGGGDDHNVEVTKDWIEEHGGNRNWWTDIRSIRDNPENY